MPANMAEGFGRGNPGDYHRHLCIAQGSLKELETLLELSQMLDFPDENLKNILASCDELGRMLRSLIGKIKARREVVK
jgi:four helix bundle protein